MGFSDGGGEGGSEGGGQGGPRSGSAESTLPAAMAALHTRSRRRSKEEGAEPECARFTQEHVAGRGLFFGHGGRLVEPREGGAAGALEAGGA